MRRPVLDVGTRRNPVQSLARPSTLDGWEGVAYSSSGDIMALAASHTDTVFLYRKGPGGSFDAQPYSRIRGADSWLRYPHDVAFAPTEGGELLAVAHRHAAIAIYRRSGDGTFGTSPEFAIRGPQTNLSFSDGVAFVPPAYDHLAVCNLETETISFYRMLSASPVQFDLNPVFELRHASFGQPDGLGFSGCGQWLAVANHGIHTVSIFRRRRRVLSGGKLRYGPRPVSVLKDATLRYPHSVAFTAETNHLVVTNAGANYFSVYAPHGRGRRLRWSMPLSHTIVGPDATFREVNARNRMEGGPKGVAIHRDDVAVCCPEYGAKIFALREPVSMTT